MQSKMILKTHALKQHLFRALLGTSCLLGTVLGAGFSPIPGSALPDAWGRPGGKVTLSVPEVVGKQVTVNGVPASTDSGQITITLPASTAPGRVRVQFVVGSTDQTITTRDIEVLAPATEASPDRRVQLLLDPKLSVDQVRSLLLRILPRIGTVNSLEKLPPALASGSPCGSTLADIQLQPGVTLEQALNQLVQGAGNDLWYPDPISRWSAGTLTQTVPIQPQNSFHYARFPVVPKVALGTPATSGLTGTGVTIAVLDTGFSAALDTTHELTTSAGALLPRVRAPINALVPYDLGNLAPSLTGAGDFWEGHGTQVAMLAAGNLNGVAPGAAVLPIKVCSEGSGQASCNTKDVLRGLCIALSSVPASKLVINLSLGGASPTGAIHAVLNWAMRQGTVVVAAGGNQHGRGLSGSDPEEYPAAFARSHAPSQIALPLLAVASVSPDGGGRVLSAATNWQFSGFSTLGRYLNISAPGEALDLGHNQLYSGTSFAAPILAGAAALARQANPGATTPAIQTLMLSASRTTPMSTKTSQSQPSLTVPMLKLSGY